MLDKFELFDRLPADIKRKTAAHLPTPALIGLAKNFKDYGTLFAPVLDVRKFLQHVVRSEHDAVTAMLTNDLNLFFKKERVTDCSGRIFENISGFEYALWALDEHTWTTILDSLPRGEASKELRKKLLSQYNQVQKEGVTYWLNGTKITEKHFDFENTIIKELKTQVDSIDGPEEDKDWAAIDKQWREGVGGAQKLLPMHVVDEYCSNKPFYPVPEFTSKPKSSKQFYNWATDKDENWFSVDSKLAVEFAIYRGRARWVARGVGCDAWMPVGIDLAAMTALCKVRTNDFIDLKSQLEDQMTLDNHHVSQI